VNEITGRDLDGNSGTGGDNYTLVYDPAGNLTSDPSSDVKYEWDAFYRLRRVRNQANDLIAEYRYNGLGYRVGVWEDTDADSDVDGSDLWYYAAYDERWRMVATYRSSDTSPKERFVHHQAGDGGFGGSSYIDLVAFREKDANTAWTSASDGTLEERLYYCQNQHADVVALITAAGEQREMVRYSAYGVPFGLPVGDCDSDGDCEVGERSLVQAWITGSAYDVRGDIDLDGDVDSTDKDAVRDTWEGVTLGRGVLTAGAVGGSFGIGGYHAATPQGFYCARARHYSSALGRWISRDTLESSDTPSLYEYVTSSPQAELDPSGAKVYIPPEDVEIQKWHDELLACCEEYANAVYSLYGDSTTQTFSKKGHVNPKKTATTHDPNEQHEYTKSGESHTASGNTATAFGTASTIKTMAHEMSHAKTFHDNKGKAKKSQKDWDQIAKDTAGGARSETEIAAQSMEASCVHDCGF